jgi:hypothetical protein
MNTGETMARIAVLGQMRQLRELALVASIGEEEMRRELEQWKAERRIFLVEHEGAEYFPVYALDAEANYRPYPAVKEIISIFGESLSVWGIASWFAGLNSFLDDQRPLDLLNTDPGWVVEAARDAMKEMTHADEEAVQQGLDDVAHDRTRPVNEVFSEIRRKNDIEGTR